MDANLQAKYHKSLKQLELLHKDNVKLKQEFNALKN